MLHILMELNKREFNWRHSPQSKSNELEMFYTKHQQRQHWSFIGSRMGVVSVQFYHVAYILMVGQVIDVSLNHKMSSIHLL